IRDFGDPDANQMRPYVVLDYFEGTTLAEHVKRCGPLSPADALAILWPIARALQAAHNRGVLHRSLSPASILIRRVEIEPPDEPDEELPSSPDQQEEATAADVGQSSSLRGEEVKLEASPPAQESSGEMPAELPPPDPEPQFAWQVKVLEMGLALRRTFLHAAASNPSARAGTGLGRGVVQRLSYTPPELTGRPKGMVWVGPHSDIFAFGR